MYVEFLVFEFEVFLAYRAHTIKASRSGVRILKELLPTL